MLILANPAQAVKILQAHAAWQRQSHEGRQDDQHTSTTRPSRRRKSDFDTTPERFDPAAAAELLDEEKLLPTVWLYAHLAGLAGDGVGEVARVEEHPVTAEWVKRHLGDRCRITVTPVLDLADQIPVDAWEIPDRHRQAVHLMTPADTFPYATNTTRGKQIDHTIP